MKRRALAKIFTAACVWLSALSAEAAVIHFQSDLGPEVPGATGSGSVLVAFDDVLNTLRITADWIGLSGTTTVAHIHCCVAPPGTVGVAVTPGTLPGFPAGLTAGSYTSPEIDLTDATSFTAGFLTNFGGGSVGGALDALLAGMANGTAYFNIHSSTFQGGEIRGFLQQVPEPATLSLALLGLAALVAVRRRA